MLRVVKAAKPIPRKAAKLISTSGRRDRQNEIRPGSMGRPMLVLAAAQHQAQRNDAPRTCAPRALGTRAQVAGSLLQPLIVHEDRTAPDDGGADLQPIADLHAAILLYADLDRTSAEQHGTLLHPHDGEIPLADDRLDRDRGAVLVSAGHDLEVREHLG